MNYEEQALRFAETYGIIEYTLNGSVMAWTETYPSEGTYHHEKDLKTGQRYVNGQER